jgi:hypothetical protein
VIMAFTLGLILIALAITSLFERSKQKSQEPHPESPAPDFPVPSLPGVSSLNVSAKSGGAHE